MEVLKIAMHQTICHCVNKMLLQSAHTCRYYTWMLWLKRLKCIPCVCCDILWCWKCVYIICALRHRYTPHMWRNIGLEGVEEMKRTRLYWKLQVFETTKSTHIIICIWNRYGVVVSGWDSLYGNTNAKQLL